ncbi:MAG: hypothetical protein H7039_19100 [Bryobacteraceae bacterium]|nr:hypothetical protein [Bryobacteraceae bacterium]
MMLRILSKRRSREWLPLLVAVVPAQMFILQRRPVLAEFAGACFGTLLFLATSRLRQGALLAAVFFLVVLVIRGLNPFLFTEAINTVTLTPFGATLESERSGALQVLIGKCFAYGAAIWLLRSAGLAMLWSATLVAAVLACIEVAQIWLPGRTPESTDALLGLALGIAIAWADRGISRDPATSTRESPAYPRRNG